MSNKTGYIVLGTLLSSIVIYVTGNYLQPLFKINGKIANIESYSVPNDAHIPLRRVGIKLENSPNKIIFSKKEWSEKGKDIKIGDSVDATVKKILLSEDLNGEDIKKIEKIIL